MSTLIRVTALCLGVVAAVGSAHAQTMSSAPVPGPSIANLPPMGPRPSSMGNIPSEAQMPVVQTGNYPGPAPGAGAGQMPTLFQKPAGYDQNVMMHPYENGIGPRPN